MILCRCLCSVFLMFLCQRSRLSFLIASTRASTIKSSSLEISPFPSTQPGKGFISMMSAFNQASCFSKVLHSSGIVSTAFASLSNSPWICSILGNVCDFERLIWLKVLNTTCRKTSPFYFVRFELLIINYQYSLELHWVH